MALMLPIQMLVTETGEYFSTDPEMYAGTWLYIGNLTVTGNAVTGTQNTGFLRAGSCDNVVCWQDENQSTVTGTIDQRDMLTLLPVNPYGEYNGSWTFDDLYNQPSSLAAITGNYTGSSGIGLGNLTIDSSGSITSANGCATGQVSLIDPAYNAYDVTITYSTTVSCPGGAESGLTAKGIASLDPNVAPTVLEMMLLWTNAAGDTGNTLEILTLE
jgi:hypothetical protein